MRFTETDAEAACSRDRNFCDRGGDHGRSLHWFGASASSENGCSAMHRQVSSSFMGRSLFGSRATNLVAGVPYRNISTSTGCSATFNSSPGEYTVSSRLCSSPWCFSCWAFSRSIARGRKLEGPEQHRARSIAVDGLGDDRRQVSKIYARAHPDERHDRHRHLGLHIDRGARACDRLGSYCFCAELHPVRRPILRDRVSDLLRHSAIGILADGSSSSSCVSTSYNS